MTTPAQLADEAKRLAEVAVRECPPDQVFPCDWMEAAMKACRIIAKADAKSAGEAREAARYRWLRSFATPGQRPAKEDMPMGYREIRLRVDTAVYMPSNWANDVDRAIDVAMSPTPSQESPQ